MIADYVAFMIVFSMMIWIMIFVWKIMDNTYTYKERRYRVVLRNCLDVMPDNVWHRDDPTWRRAWDELSRDAHEEVKDVRKCALELMNDNGKD